jgi:ATP-dependent DNA helicase RecG
MDDDILAPIRGKLATLPGVGPRIGTLLARAAEGERVLDLLFHLPVDYIDRRGTPPISSVIPGRIVTLAVEVVRHDPPARKGQPYRVLVKDNSGFAEIVFFTPARLLRFPLGGRVLVSGKLDLFNGMLTMAHPDYVVPEARRESLPWIEPVWGLTKGLFPWMVMKAMAGALALLPALPEWQRPDVLARRNWPSFGAALRALHQPLELPAPGIRERLAYDELLARQLAYGKLRLRARRRPGRALVGDGALRTEALARFGHQPTPSQQAALAEIDADLAAPHRMLRLLQGDVGSGKTLVALLAMLRAVEAGYQAALLVPTELLAQQHYRVFSALCPAPVALLTGHVKAAARRKILAGLADGSFPIIIGTHALFQDKVAFHDLALAVIDEQHRFGVDQRLRLGAKGHATDILVMTATPIPRTLLLTHWGEMAVSRIAEKPAGRKPIKTTLHKQSALETVLAGLERAIKRGGQIYWVCPLVGESELIDIAAAEMRYATLAERFGDAVTLAHGRQNVAVREAALADFAAGRRRILVATTVIEVGVDVPSANIMVIEHAERFGLAQLHQLRGRIGRGAAQSYCLLIHDTQLSQTARKRLMLLRDTQDGFVIADADFDLRGAGDALGTRQSGLPGYRLANPETDADLLTMAHQDAQLRLQPSADNAATDQPDILLLRLFNQDEAAAGLEAG